MTVDYLLYFPSSKDISFLTELKIFFRDFLLPELIKIAQTGYWRDLILLSINIMYIVHTLQDYRRLKV